jgi:hypothetical protein
MHEGVADDTAEFRPAGNMCIILGRKIPCYSLFRTKQGIWRNLLIGNNETPLSDVGILSKQGKFENCLFSGIHEAPAGRRDAGEDAVLIRAACTSGGHL